MQAVGLDKEEDAESLAKVAIVTRKSSFVGKPLGISALVDGQGAMIYRLEKPAGPVR
jgi:hypothetical protein